MKLLLITLAFFAFISLVHLAPARPEPTRELVLPQYDDEDDATPDVKKIVDNDDEEDETDNDDEDEDDTTTTTTTTTTTKTTSRAPRTSFSGRTRDRIYFQSRRTFSPVQTSSSRTSTASSNFDELYPTETPNYDGDFRYIRDFRQYVQQLLEDIRKLVTNLTGYDFTKSNQRMNYPPTMSMDD